MAEKILNSLRIVLKIFVNIVTFCVFVMAVVYWTEQMRPASVPLVIVSALSYFCVIKDHSEDFLKSKFDDPMMESLGMMTIYLITLNVILFGIVISARLK